jgi:hypothetical protein
MGFRARPTSRSGAQQTGKTPSAPIATSAYTAGRRRRGAGFFTRSPPSLPLTWPRHRPFAMLRTGALAPPRPLPVFAETRLVQGPRLPFSGRRRQQHQAKKRDWREQVSCPTAPQESPQQHQRASVVQ